MANVFDVFVFGLCDQCLVYILFVGCGFGVVWCWIVVFMLALAGYTCVLVLLRLHKLVVHCLTLVVRCW